MKKHYTKVYLIPIFSFLIIFNTSAQVIDYANIIIDTLCSNEMAGRAYVNNGHIKVANYIENEFKKIGLKNFNDTYTQNFRINANTFPSEINISINDSLLVEGKDFLVDPACPSIKGLFEPYYVSPNIFQEEVITPHFFNSIQNKLIVLNLKLFEGNDHLNEIQKFLFSLKPSIHKHKGIFIINSSKLTWHISRKVSETPIIYLDNKFNSVEIKTIELLIKNKFCKNVKTQNVIGYVEGTEIPDSFFVFTAHYDHLGKMGNAIFRGANDNASGIAMLLNLAKYFKDNPPKYSIVFIALGAEELGLIGSFYYAENPFHSLSKTKFLINIDLAGTGDEGIQVVNGSIFKEEFNKLKTLNDSLKLLPQVKIRGESCNSDHCPFYQKGVPSFFIYTLGGIKAYHDIYDIPQTLPLTKFEEYSDLLTKFIEN
jgi:aminopeptidase YwaD